MTPEDIARLSASEIACYRWPEDTTEHRAMRAAFMDGAAHTVSSVRAQEKLDRLDAEIGMLREKLSDALAGGLPHYSDCAVYQAPAYEPGPCNCGVGISADDRALDLVRKIREHNGWSRIATDADAVNLVKAFVASSLTSTGGNTP